MRLTKLLLVLAVVLSACTTAPVVTSNVVTPPPVSIPVIAPTNLQNVKFDLVTSSSLAAFEQQFKTDPNAQFYVLDRSNMQTMISNIQEMRRYILSQQASITYLGNALSLYTTKAK
ncbi:hypothetical protein [Burkholderia multivorans]|uniref:hypothetical protein n=1 Tax=Burkholderia multivorans TaxID=87883 RepID=UPI0011B1EE7D|nr:hypothetical protein [Burkholderia multivorans]